MYNDSDFIARMAAELAKQLRPSLPIEIDLWDIATIATYLKRSESVVRERMACLPDFPKAIRLPSTRSGRGHALYRAKEVIQWASRYQDKN
ncbi:hypothetical protein [Massilia sp. YIM B02443]|uniref:hypothetical protein n=1 Tax=Massilia sp. YIM B02443 TaxID=3050127 RepID=UPI0025B65932|nr:hypothetical protein [Massilia sp. YIM B02443]MDN4036769.1 hypothetical protein [Massilia sp. YIM B02443]